MSFRRFTISQQEARKSLGQWLQQRLGVPHAEAQQMVRDQRVWMQGRVCLDYNLRLQRGQQIEIRPPRKSAQPERSTPKRPVERSALQPSVLHYVDDHLLVVEKPTGLTTMRHPEDVAEFGSRARKYLPPTLADLLPELLTQAEGCRPAPLRAVHRLDKETTGLLVFARTAEAERHLGVQFRDHSIQRSYLALVRGQAHSARIESWLVNDRGDGRRGSGSATEGQQAVTHVQLRERLGAYSFVECQLETGRTHQVRIHLGEAGTPLCGEKIYDRPLHGRPFPDNSGARRVMLHAATLGLVHPASGKRLQWTSRLPRDMEQLLQRFHEQQQSGS